jgi:hypothetical protein
MNAVEEKHIRHTPSHRLLQQAGKGVVGHAITICIEC